MFGNDDIDDYMTYEYVIHCTVGYSTVAERTEKKQLYPNSTVRFFCTFCILLENYASTKSTTIS